MLIAIALMTLSATAQNQKNRTGDFKDLSPEEVATLNTKRMTLHIDLSASQQAEVKALMLEEAKHRKQLKAKRDENREKNASEKPSKEERYTMVNERLDRQIEMKKKMKNILSAEQYEKWELHLSDKNKTKTTSRF